MPGLVGSSHYTVAIFDQMWSKKVQQWRKSSNGRRWPGLRNPAFFNITCEGNVPNVGKRDGPRMQYEIFSLSNQSKVKLCQLHKVFNKHVLVYFKFKVNTLDPGDYSATRPQC